LKTHEGAGGSDEGAGRTSRTSKLIQSKCILYFLVMTFGLIQFKMYVFLVMILGLRQFEM